MFWGLIKRPGTQENKRVVRGLNVMKGAGAQREERFGDKMERGPGRSGLGGEWGQVLGVSLCHCEQFGLGERSQRQLKAVGYQDQN